MEIRDCTYMNGKGLFATQPYKKGESIYTLSGKIFSAPTRETIHIGDNYHIYDQFGIYINHSFSPNIYINGIYIVALQDIKNNDELRFNYNDTEINMAAQFYANDILVCGKKLEQNKEQNK